MQLKDQLKYFPLHNWTILLPHHNSHIPNLLSYHIFTQQLAPWMELTLHLSMNTILLNISVIQ